MTNTLAYEATLIVSNVKTHNKQYSIPRAYAKNLSIVLVKTIVV
jgi:hypothetical protein